MAFIVLSFAIMLEICLFNFILTTSVSSIAVGRSNFVSNIASNIVGKSLIDMPSLSKFCKTCCSIVILIISGITSFTSF